jgi:hypothetical protein
MRKHNPHHLRVWIPNPRSVDDLSFVGKGNSMMHIPRFWRVLWYLVFLAVLTLGIVLYTLAWSRGTAFKDFGLGRGSMIGSSAGGDANQTDVVPAEHDDLPEGVHPIEHLMKIAEKYQVKIARHEIHNLPQAAAQYRKVRGRHPPPGFAAWYAYAESLNATINERFWDQIYLDLAPFWSLDPVILRKQANVLSPKISIRDGRVEAKSHNEHSKLEIWKDMFTALSNEVNVHLPDVDIPLNVNEESAMLAPWEAIDTAISMSREMMLEPSDMVSRFSGLGDIENLTATYSWKPEWLGPRLTYPSSHLGPRPLWSLVRPACPPRSPARLEHVYNDVWDPKVGVKEAHSVTGLLPLDLPQDTLKGYVKNWTNTIGACQHANLQGLHSAFVSPKEMGISTKLFPLFGDAKVSMSNEILLPGVAEWNTSTPFSNPVSWDNKQNKLHWRGPSTIAREPQRYWRRFQRERLLSMLNATHIEIAEAAIHTGNESTVGAGYANNFRLLPANGYKLKTQTGGSLAEWVNGWADAGFTDLTCEASGATDEGCGEYFSIAPSSTSNEEDATKARYAIVIDNDSLTQHLQDGKVTLRSSIYRQWYDSRLIPWHHFVPMDNTFVDLYGIMEYFLGSDVDPDTRTFAHAVGEVQAHDHHFKTPENSEEVPHDSSQSGNEPHIPPSRRSSHGDAARQIAEASQEWAKRVLRREDVLIYVYRLLLEYARVIDDRRDRLGWVADLE